MRILHAMRGADDQNTTNGWIRGFPSAKTKRAKHAGYLVASCSQVSKQIGAAGSRRSMEAVHWASDGGAFSVRPCPPIYLADGQIPVSYSIPPFHCVVRKPLVTRREAVMVEHGGSGMVGLRDYSRSEVKGSVPWTVPAQPRR